MMNKKKLISIKGRPAISIVYLLLRISVIFVIINQLKSRDYENIFLCILTLILFLIPSFIEKKIHIDIPDTLETIILLFIFSAENSWRN